MNKKTNRKQTTDAVILRGNNDLPVFWNAWAKYMINRPASYSYNKNFKPNGSQQHGR
jgi:hypothetical protein